LLGTAPLLEEAQAATSGAIQTSNSNSIKSKRFMSFDGVRCHFITTTSIRRLVLLVLKVPFELSEGLCATFDTIDLSPLSVDAVESLFTVA
jgi:hypothetical protein